MIHCRWKREYNSQTRALCCVSGDSSQVHGQPSLGQNHCPAVGTGLQFGHDGDAVQFPWIISGKGEAGHSQKGALWEARGAGQGCTSQRPHLLTPSGGHRAEWRQTPASFDAFEPQIHPHLKLWYELIIDMSLYISKEVQRQNIKKENYFKCWTAIM